MPRLRDSSEQPVTADPPSLSAGRERGQTLKDRAFFAAQRRVRDAERELKAAEDAVWALLQEGNRHV